MPSYEKPSKRGALLTAIHGMGASGCPSGHLYATVMGHLSLTEYQECIACLKAIGAVKESGHLLTCTL